MSLHRMGFFAQGLGYGNAPSYSQEVWSGGDTAHMHGL